MHACYSMRRVMLDLRMCTHACDHVITFSSWDIFGPNSHQFAHVATSLLANMIFKCSRCF